MSDKPQILRGGQPPATPSALLSEVVVGPMEQSITEGAAAYRPSVVLNPTPTPVITPIQPPAEEKK